MNETSQQQADRLLVEDRAARAMRSPFGPSTICGGCHEPIADGWTDRGRAWLKAGTPIGDAFAAFAMPFRRAPADALGDRFGRAPYSRAYQVRNALLEAFASEPPAVRRHLRDTLEGATDATLERAGRLLKHS